MAYNKITYGGKTLIDLTSDTVDAEHLAKGYVAHDKSGKVIEGNAPTDANALVIEGYCSFKNTSAGTGYIIANKSVLLNHGIDTSDDSIYDTYHITIELSSKEFKESSCGYTLKSTKAITEYNPSGNIRYVNGFRIGRTATSYSSATSYNSDKSTRYIKQQTQGYPYISSSNGNIYYFAPSSSSYPCDGDYAYKISVWKQDGSPMFSK